MVAAVGQFAWCDHSAVVGQLLVVVMEVGLFDMLNQQYNIEPVSWIERAEAA